NAKADRPTAFLTFLGDVLGHDAEAIDALQEWFGYVLSPATRLQKMLLLVGPPRSGKGTIARILAELVGPDCVAGPTLSSLATNCGLEPLIGSPLAIVSDARFGRRSDHPAVVSRLLAISGEDRLTVDRKFRQPWSGPLPTRIMVCTNELPQF